MEDGLDVNKLIGIGTDGANSIVGRHHSLITLLKNDNPEITLIRCVRHSLHLAASKACENLPTVLDFLVRDTHTWFSNSPNRINKYTELYKVLEDGVPKKVPGLASTRWLSRFEAIRVILASSMGLPKTAF
ncbi:SCAN domain-containing protein 3-like [Oratosquilla oratoria]|uniref:SCAN domain-containing protein 3-like n=1 Tax=Oratosquilla oratoria TaxID=337810 RepID=UPI003F76146E